MTVGIVGLGLIGGSMAKSIKARTAHTVFGCDLDQETMMMARMCGAIDAPLTAEKLKECDLVLVAIRPAAAVKWVKEHAEGIRRGAILVDLCGVKRAVVRELAPVAEQYGFAYIGGHPMAGVERWGFDSSFGMLFNNASMILTPDGGTDIALLHEIKQMFLSIGFGSITVVSPEQHDRIIAYTSQLAHVVASAYIKSPTALEHTGMSAGSYKDMTRVASLNSNMWSELFLENGDNLLNEIDNIINNLTEYRDAIASNDRAKLEALLEDGTKRKAICG